MLSNTYSKKALLNVSGYGDVGTVRIHILKRKFLRIHIRKEKFFKYIFEKEKVGDHERVENRVLQILLSPEPPRPLHKKLLSLLKLLQFFKYIFEKEKFFKYIFENC